MIIHVPSFSFRLEILLLVVLVGTFLLIYTLRSCCRYSVHEFMDQLMNAIMPIEKEPPLEKKEEEVRPMDIMWYTPEIK